MKAAAAVLAASLVFFLGVLTGVGRREAVPPPDAITLGAVNGPAAPDSGDPTDEPSPGTPNETATTTTSTAPAAPPSTGGPPRATATTGPTGTTGPPGATVTTGPATTGPATTPPTGTPAATRPPNTTTTRPGDVEEVDGQVNCRSQGKGKREPCPSTTTATGETPGGGPNQR